VVKNPGRARKRSLVLAQIEIQRSAGQHTVTMTEDPSLPSLVLLPGLDGTGRLFSEFVRVMGSEIDAQIVAYPKDEPLGYAVDYDTAPKARLVEIDGPHLLLQTCPQECAAAVMRFVRTLA
jgi:hypothetical protein